MARIEATNASKATPYTMRSEVNWAIRPPSAGEMMLPAKNPDDTSVTARWTLCFPRAAVA